MNEIKKYSATIVRCKKILEKYLKYCNEKRTPYLCALKETKEGYKEIEDFVLQATIKGHNSVGEAIMDYERQLNPNYITD
jgi:hypothetical protein